MVSLQNSVLLLPYSVDLYINFPVYTACKHLHVQLQILFDVRQSKTVGDRTGQYLLPQCVCVSSLLFDCF